MAKLAHKNLKNASTNYILFELNCDFHPRVFYKENVDPCSKLKTVDQLAIELQTLIFICRENFQHA